MKQKNFSFYTTLSQQDLFKQLDTSQRGLTLEQIRKRLALYGHNTFTQNNATWITIFINQILNPFMYILFLIEGTYLYTYNFTESFIVLIIITLNIGIGFYQEYSSNKAMLLLKKYLTITIETLRDNKKFKLPTDQLVPGDIIFLSVGDIIPADCRFIADENIAIDESSMTGESVAITKTSTPASQLISNIHKANNIGFTGTVVIEGKGTAVVFATGNRTELGSIATLTQKTKNKSNLEKSTAQLAHLIILFITIAIVFIFFLNIILKKGSLNFVELLLFSAALAITAAPEALPLVTTFCLSRGASRLKKNHVIVKRLSAIGDLGSIEIFCTDKTGTLTENSLKVESICSDDPNQTIIYAALFSTPPDKEKHQKGFENALYKALTPEQIDALNSYTLLQEQPFTAEKRRSCALIQKGKQQYILLTKGSPEHVFALCTITDEEKHKINKWMKHEEERGNRIIAIGTKEIVPQSSHSIKEQDHSYASLGLISFIDPIKETSFATIKMAKTLNIQIKIISGDSKYVCFAVAQKLGLEYKLSNVVTGTDFEEASEEKKEFFVENYSIFARINPQQKYEIIKILQKKYSIGYIGDGVNDAPALKLADVGFAVQDSCSVAQESADIILLENNLLILIRSIKEGRKIVTNILKYVTITASSSFGHLYALSFLSLFSSTPPILPLQLLLLNVLTDLPMMALSTDNVDIKDLTKPVFYNIKEILCMIIVFSVFVCFFDIIIFTMLHAAAPAVQQAAWCIMILISEVIFIFIHRAKTSIFRTKKPSTPLIFLSLVSVFIILILPYTYIGQRFFIFAPPDRGQILWLMLFLIGNALTAEGIKLLYYRIKNSCV